MYVCMYVYGWTDGFKNLEGMDDGLEEDIYIRVLYIIFKNVSLQM